MSNRYKGQINKDVRLIHRHRNPVSKQKMVCYKYYDVTTSKRVRSDIFLELMMKRQLFRVIDASTKKDVTNITAWKAFIEVMAGKLTLFEMWKLMEPHFQGHIDKNYTKQEESKKQEIVSQLSEEYDLLSILGIGEDYGEE